MPWMRKDILETNFVRDVNGDLYGENPARVVYYERATAKALLKVLPQPLVAIAALASGFAAEWRAIEAMTVADLDLTKASERPASSPAHGTGRTLPTQT